jgi:hypothetical protein
MSWLNHKKHPDDMDVDFEVIDLTDEKYYTDYRAATLLYKISNDLKDNSPPKDILTNAPEVVTLEKPCLKCCITKHIDCYEIYSNNFRAATCIACRNKILLRCAKCKLLKPGINFVIRRTCKRTKCCISCCKRRGKMPISNIINISSDDDDTPLINSMESKVIFF